LSCQTIYHFTQIWFLKVMFKKLQIYTSFDIFFASFAFYLIDFFVIDDPLNPKTIKWGFLGQHIENFIILTLVYCWSEFKIMDIIKKKSHNNLILCCVMNKPPFLSIYQSIKFAKIRFVFKPISNLNFFFWKIWKNWR
jgi:hypothetical protein